jgi:putative two-component system response regulator
MIEAAGAMTLVDPVLGMRILVVDDEPLNVELLAAILGDAGFTKVETTTSSILALKSCALRTPDLLLLDLHMPGTDGFEVMDTLGPAIRTDAGPPVLVLTADVTQATRHRALSAGARDFISKPFDHEEVLLRVRNLLTVRSCERKLAEHNERLEDAVRERTRELEASRLEVLDRLALVAEFRDDDTNQHAQRVGRSAAAIAAALELPPELQELLGPAAALHDIGKIAIPDSILRKPGALTCDEFAEMQTHTTIGARMLAGSRFPVLQTAGTIALTHHERFDGAGYPAGLAGEAIPIEGRIAAVADVFDALTSDRVYRPAFGCAVALEMMREESGKHFDPVVLGALLERPGWTRSLIRRRTQMKLSATLPLMAAAVAEYSAALPARLR